MSYNKVKSSLENIDKQEIVLAEELFDLLKRAMLDTRDVNKLKNITDIACKDISDLAQNMFVVSKAILDIYEKNLPAFSAAEGHWENRMNSITSELKEHEAQIDDFNMKISRVESETKSLTVQEAELRKLRGHLLNKEEECRELKVKIDHLSDPVLDSYDEQAKQLNAELKEREAIRDEKQRVVDDITLKVNAAAEQLSDLETQEKQLLSDSERLEKDFESKTEDIKNTERRIIKLNEEISKIQDSVPDKERMLKGLEVRVDSYVQAWNSIAQQAITGEYVIKEQEEAGEVTRRFFEEEESKLKELLENYKAKLRTVIIESEKLTKEADKPNNTEGEAQYNVET